MEIKRCENGHFFDAEVNRTCPQCGAEGHSYDEEVNRTCPQWAADERDSNDGYPDSDSGYEPPIDLAIPPTVYYGYPDSDSGYEPPIDLDELPPLYYGCPNSKRIKKLNMRKKKKKII